MKRFIVILAVVCTVFIGCCVGVSAFENGDVLDDYVTINVDTSNSLYDSLRSCKYWVRSGSNSFFLSDVPLVGSTNFYLHKSGSVFLILNSKGSSITSPSGQGYCQGGYISSNYDIKDNSGNVVFPLPPEPTPTPEPVEAPEGIVEAIRAQIPGVLHLILMIVIALFLGGILLVIWKPLFRMLRTQLLTLFRR